MQFGYYGMNLGAGASQQVAPITTAGQTAVSVSTPDAATLAPLSALFVWNESPTGYGAEFLNHLPAIWDAVYNGMNLIIHDRYVTDAASILPGTWAPGTFVRRSTSAENNLDIFDNTGAVANGPGGALTDTSLDGGANSSQGFVSAAALPATAEVLVTQADASRVVTFGYQYGAGHIYYSTIPLDFYLRGQAVNSPVALVDAMKAYAANLVALVADQPTNTPVDLPAVAEDSGTVSINFAQLAQDHGSDDDGAVSLVLTGPNAPRIVQGRGTLVPTATPGVWDYTPAANDDTRVVFGYGITDGQYTTGGIARLDLTPVNDAPTLAQEDINLAGTNEDSISPANTVQDMLAAAGWRDGDTGALQGLAITASTGAGQWSYSTDGAVWVPFNVAASQPLALLLGAGSSVRYAPVGPNGEKPTLSFRAWDQTSGAASTSTASSTASITSSGGSTAFSSTSTTAALMVSAVNDAPTLSVPAFNLPATDEDSPTTTTVGALLAAAGWADVDTNALQGVVFTGKTGAGQWQWTTEGTRWLALEPTPLGLGNPMMASSFGLNTTLRYIPRGDQAETATLTFRAWDQTQGRESVTFPLTSPDAMSLSLLPQENFGGSSSQSTATSTAGLVVGAVNDAPTLVGSLFPLPDTNEDTATAGITVAALLAAAGWADVDAAPLKGLAITGLKAAGLWEYSTGGATWTPIGTPTATAAVLLGEGALLRYVPDGRNGETTWLNFRAWDQTSGTASSDGSVSTGNTSSNGGSTAFSSSIGSATLVVAAVGDAPTTRPVMLNAMPEDGPALTITQAQLLAHARDVDLPAQTLSVSQVQVNGNGTLVDTGNGTWAYTPARDDDTSVSFSYTISDGTDNVAGTATLDITPVNDAPTTALVTLNAAPEDSSALLITPAQLLARAVDVDTPRAGLSVSNLQVVGKGSLSADGNGNWLYTPAPDDDTGVVFSYTINDGAATVAGTATLDLLPVNDAPTTGPMTLLPALAEDSGTFTITQALLLANATDGDSGALRAENLQISDGLGRLVDNGDGSWNYTPATNDDTSVSFSYRVTDGLLSAAASATLDITPVNDRPVAVNDSAQTVLNTSVSVAVLENDSDIDSPALQVSSVNRAANGRTEVGADGVSVRYTPNAGFSGFDSFSYTASDGEGGTASASVRVFVVSGMGTGGADMLLGTQRADHVLGLDGNDRILVHDGDDYVDGGRGADTITGGAGADTLLGGEGADTFLATSSELAGDQIDGGEGTDLLIISNAPASLPANFSFSNLEQISFVGSLLVEHSNLLDLSGLTLASGSSNSIIGGIANNRITGTASADHIVDSAGNDDLQGAGGNDTIQGGFGQDTINGGTGNDVLRGGTATAGNDFVRDIFVFNTPLNAATNVDQIIGFEATNQDRIELDTRIFTALTGGTTTGLDAEEFRSINGGMAQDGNDFIVFDPATGNLFYDADGSGAGARVLFATLVGTSGVLDVTDFGVSGAP